MTEFKFKQITINGFKSFKTKQTFQLDRAPGLYFIGGRNELKPRLGSNGVGKTTIWDAFVWCIEGKIIDEVEGNHLKSWAGGKICEVILDFEKNTNVCCLTRKQGPNSLTLSINGGKEETKSQAEIEAFFEGMDHEKLLYIAILGQGKGSFLDLTPTPQLNLMSSIIGLDFWERCSKIATEKNNALSGEGQRLLGNKTGLESKVTSIESNLIELKTKKVSFESEQKTQIKELETKADSVLFAVNKDEEKEKEFAEQVTTKKQELEPFNNDMERIHSNIDKINLDIKSVDKNIAALKERKESLTKTFNKLKALTDKCPYCEQPVDADFIKAEKTKINKEIIEINKSSQSYQATITALEEQKKANLDKLALIDQEFQSKQAEVSLLESQKTSITAAKVLKLQELRHVREALDRLKTQEDPYSSLLVKSQQDLESSRKEIEQCSKNIEQINRDILGISYWTKGFKELRLWVISDALEALGIESNNALSELGLPDWTLKFQMEKETTKGTLSKGFNVFVNSPDLKPGTFVPFKIWCGGETQRLKLATTIGLSSLISSYKGINLNIFVVDEPSIYLSDEGIEDLIRLLSEYAKANDKTIYWIDQRYLQSNLFDGTIKVVKTEEGSIIQ